MVEWLLAAALHFPDIEARDLNGRERRIGELAGAPCVVALGFSYDSRRQIEPWTKQILRETDGRLPVIVMPVLRGVPAALRRVVEGAMAAATPGNLRPYAWTTSDSDRLRQSLGLGASGEAAIVLLDGATSVRFVARGEPTPTAVRGLIDAWRGF